MDYHGESVCLGSSHLIKDCSKKACNYPTQELLAVRTSRSLVAV